MLRVIGFEVQSKERRIKGVRVKGRRWGSVDVWVEGGG
jgi:hypothetical protein